MSTLGKAIIQFAADTVGFRGDVGRAVAIFESGIGRMQKAFGGWKSQLAAGITIGGAALFAKSLLEQADELSKLSEKTGRQVEELSELKLAYELGGGAADGYSRGLREFNKSLVESTNNSSRAAKVFAALGVDVKAGPVAAFRQFADSFSQLPDDLRVSVVSEILGKAGEGWIPVLAKGAKGLDEVAERARRLGLVVSTDFARQAEEFNDNLKLLEKGAVSLGNALLSSAAPALSSMSERMVKAAQDGRKLAETIDIIRAIAAFSVPDSAPAEARRRAAVNQGTGGNEDLVDAMMQGRLASGRIKGAPASERSLTASLFKPDPNAVRQALADSDALAKRQANALQQMEEKKRSLFDLDEQQLMLLRITTGSYKDFDSNTKVRLLNLAAEIDGRKELVDRMDAEMAHVQALNAVRERGDEIFSDFLLTNRANLDQIKFETSLLGLSTREQERRNAAHQIELDLLARKRAAALAYGEDAAGAEQEVARLEKEAARQAAEVDAAIVKRQALERSWLMGAKGFFVQYAEDATNAADNVRQAFSGTFFNLEGELTSLVRRGQFDLGRLADATLDEFAHAAIRQFATGPLAQGLGGLLGQAGSIGGFKLLDVESTKLSTTIVAMDGAMLNATTSTVALDAALLNAATAAETFAAAAAGSAGAGVGAGAGLAALFGGGAAGGAGAAAGAADAAPFMAAFAANGGIMTSRGMLPLKAYSSGGIARGPQLAVFGEGRMPEAYVPLPDGKRIPVALQGGGAASGRGGPNVYIDARGADREGMARLELLVARLDGQLEQRAVAAVDDRMARGGQFRRRMRA